MTNRTAKTSTWNTNTGPRIDKMSSYDRFRFQQRETCHHEAGHAVAAHQLGIPLSTVSVKEDANSYGHVTLSKRASTFNPKNMTPAKTEEWVQKHGIVCLAGAAGSLGFSGNPNWKGAAEDLAVLESILQAVSPTEADQEVRRNQLWKEAKRLIERDWKLVCAIADALYRKGSLNSREVGEEIRKA